MSDDERDELRDDHRFVIHRVIEIAALFAMAAFGFGVYVGKHYAVR